jgi:hypothetical protein
VLKPQIVAMGAAVLPVQATGSIGAFFYAKNAPKSGQVKTKARRVKNIQ